LFKLINDCYWIIVKIFLFWRMHVFLFINKICSMQNKKEILYHKMQFDSPYRSTIAFWDWILSMPCMKGSDTILDIGTGMGSNVFYFQRVSPEKKFIGIDQNVKLIEVAKKHLLDNFVTNISFDVGDLYNLSKEKYVGIDGIVSLQLLSWLENYEQPLQSMFDLSPRWIAASSLFYEGCLESYTTVRDYYRPDIFGNNFSLYHYNIYSLDKVKKLFFDHGYPNFYFVPFHIDIDLERNTKDLGTYTITTKHNERLQFTGPLYLPWYFIFASK